MADIFDQIHEEHQGTEKPAPPPLPAEQSKEAAQSQSGDIFNQLPQRTIGPTFPGPGLPHPTQQQTDQAFIGTARAAAQYLPSTVATIAAMTQPELWPGLLAAGLGALGGSAAKQGVQTALDDPNAPKSWGEAAQTAGLDVLTNVGSEAGGRALAWPIQKVAGKIVNPRSMYQKALKPSGTPEEVAKIVGTGLKEGIPVSQEGYQQAVNLIDNLNSQIDKQISGSNLGPVIDPRNVAQRVEQIRPTFQQQVNPLADLDALSKTAREFVEQHTTYAPYTKIRPGTEEAAGTFVPAGEGKTPIVQNLTPAEAQQIKKGTYVQLRKKYGELGTADIEGQKALTRGLREDIGTLFPGLNNLNARDAAVIDLEQALAKHVVRAGNSSGGSIALPLILGAMSGHAPESLALALVKRGLGDPEVKSKLAIALAKAAASRTGRAVKAVGRAALPTAVRAVQPIDTSKPIRINPNAPAAGLWRDGGLFDDVARRSVDRAAVLRSLRKG